MSLPDEVNLFGRRALFPDPSAKDRLDRLVGLDQHKESLRKLLAALINPAGMEGWAKKHHPQAGPGFIESVLNRPPLVVLAGDVGSGKTELAETIGDAVARQEKIEITLLPLSLSARGQGRVGEMTQLLTAAFETIIEEAKKLKHNSRKSTGAVILLVDEADAIAQSREMSQMHHEDRAGVNAFIRGVDDVAKQQLPAAIITCTNRLGALDPAVKRRAALILEFCRPSDELRKQLLSSSFEALGFTEEDVDALVQATGPAKGREYGFTFSDIAQRLIPGIVLDAYPDQPVTPARALQFVASVVPTPPFEESGE